MLSGEAVMVLTTRRDAMLLLTRVMSMTVVLAAAIVLAMTASGRIAGQDNLSQVNQVQIAVHENRLATAAAEIADLKARLSKQEVANQVTEQEMATLKGMGVAVGFLFALLQAVQVVIQIKKPSDTGQRGHR